MRSLALLLISSTALAYDPITHAGLAERAATVSALGVGDRLGRPLGLYEQLTVQLADDELGWRLRQLDPALGCAPEFSATFDRGRQTALGWLIAGAVLEGVPAARMRNHFFDARDGRGLSQGDRKLATRIAAARSGVGSVRGIFTGANFDGTGRPALEWLRAPRGDNDWGLARFWDERLRAATAATPEERDDALARALLAAGHVLHLVAGMADPAFVRNDYREAFEQLGGPYQRAVAERYGTAVPAPDTKKTAVAATVDDLVRHLAKETASRFFSPGTLDWPTPSAHVVDKDVLSDDGHLLAVLAGGRRALDNRVYLDNAARLLPEAGAASVNLLDILWRGRLAIRIRDGAVRVSLHDAAIGGGTLTVLADDSTGRRSAVEKKSLDGAKPGDELWSASVPSGARRLTFVFSGVGPNGERLVISGEQPVLPR
jgi:hypothetical protein